MIKRSINQQNFSNTRIRPYLLHTNTNRDYNWADGNNTTSSTTQFGKSLTQTFDALNAKTYERTRNYVSGNNYELRPRENLKQYRRIFTAK